MGKDFPADNTAHHPGTDMAWPDYTAPKIVPGVPASQSERPQLRPVLKPLQD